MKLDLEYLEGKVVQFQHLKKDIKMLSSLEVLKAKEEEISKLKSEIKKKIHTVNFPYIGTISVPSPAARHSACILGQTNIYNSLKPNEIEQLPIAGISNTPETPSDKNCHCVVYDTTILNYCTIILAYSIGLLYGNPPPNDL